MVVLKQILNLIPRGMITPLALATGAETKDLTFSVVGRLSAMLFAQLFHAMGLNDICDWLCLKSGVLAHFGVNPPSGNKLSNVNKEHGAEFAERLFWLVLDHLERAGCC